MPSYKSFQGCCRRMEEAPDGRGGTRRPHPRPCRHRRYDEELLSVDGRCAIDGDRGGNIEPDAAGGVSVASLAAVADGVAEHTVLIRGLLDSTRAISCEFVHNEYCCARLSL